MFFFSVLIIIKVKKKKKRHHVFSAKGLVLFDPSDFWDFIHGILLIIGLDLVCLFGLYVYSY